MSSVFKHKWRVALAAVALGSIGLSGTAFAQNTASGTSITNTATVNYTVASVTQTPVAASTLRTRLLFRSAMKTLPAGSTATPKG